MNMGFGTYISKEGTLPATPSMCSSTENSLRASLMLELKDRIPMVPAACSRRRWRHIWREEKRWRLPSDTLKNLSPERSCTHSIWAQGVAPAIRLGLSDGCNGEWKRHEGCRYQDGSVRNAPA